MMHLIWQWRKRAKSESVDAAGGGRGYQCCCCWSLSQDTESPPTQILDGMLTRRFRFVLSIDLLMEYRSVLLHERIQKLHGLTKTEIDTLLEALTANALLQEPISHLNDTPPDPGDAHLWRLLAARDGLILVTGDKALQRFPPPFAGVLSPSSFLVLVR